MSFLLLEDGDRIILESETGFLRTEDAISATSPPIGQRVTLAASTRDGRTAGFASSALGGRAVLID